MAVKINSEASCRAAYIDYYTNADTKVTEAEMRQIVRLYDVATRQSWQAAFKRVSSDENKYEFDDDQFEDIRLESYKDTEDNYGEDVNVKAVKDRNTWDGIGTGIAVGGATAGIALGAGAAVNQFSCLANIGGKAGKILSKLGKFAEKIGTKKAGWIGFIASAISCITTFAIGLNAKNNKANKEEIKAVNDLYSEIETQNEVVADQEVELKTIRKNIEKASDKATDANNEANEEIQNKTTQHSGYTNTYKVLQAKIDSGQQLTSSEIQLYNGIVKIMQSSSTDIETCITKADGVLKENKGVIEGFESDFDVVAENIASIQGITDYAAQIDEATQKSCETQAKIQKIASFSGYTAVAGMAISTATCAAQVGWPLGLLVIAGGAALTFLAVKGAIWLGKSAKEQAQFAMEATNEVVLRKEVEVANTKAAENLEEGIDSYNVSNAAIKTATIYKPNNLVVPTNNNPFSGVNNNNDDGEGDKKGPRFLT